MNKLRLSSWLIGLALIATAGQEHTWPDQPPPCAGTYAPGMVLVGFQDESWQGLDDGLQPRSGWLSAENIVATMPGIHVATLHVPIGKECAALETLRHDPRVAFAELDYAVRPAETWFLEETGFLTPNDPGWAQQWGPAKIGAPAAWVVATGTPDVVVAVLDSGIQLNQEDLADRLWINPGEVPGNGIDDDTNGKVDDLWGWRFYHAWAWDGETYTYLPREDGRVADDLGHGTHVAGIAGATINNSVGVAGMAGGSRLMAVKVLDEYENGWYSDVAQGIAYAVDNGARIINLSLGGELPSQTLQESVNYAHAHGVLVVASAGNDGGEVLYPAACEHVLAVAATDQNDQWTPFSNHGSQVDVAAPGKDIYSTWYRSNYATKSGTSMAAPHVSGLGALMWSARPDLAVEQVTHIITSTAVNVNADTLPGWDEHVGWGRIEADRALSATVHAGRLHVSSSSHQLMVGETATITATVPFTGGTTDLFVFTASGGTVSPTLTSLNRNTVTATLVAGPADGIAVITGTTGMLSGSLFLRLLPGPVVSATLTPALTGVATGHSTAVTLTATDGSGNPPLNGTAIIWTANGGAVVPTKSPFHEGVGQATFIAGPIQGTAVITAQMETGVTIRVTIDVTHPPHHYLPVILHHDESQRLLWHQDN